jgi:hypothetical protein
VYSTPVAEFAFVAAIRDFLDFSNESPVGVDADFTSRNWGVTTGLAVPLNDDTLFAAAYDRNENVPSPDFAARAIHGTSTLANYDARSFSVGGGRNISIAESQPLNSSPAIGHYRSWQLVYMFFTKHE